MYQRNFFMDKTNSPTGENQTNRWFAKSVLSTPGFYAALIMGSTALISLIKVIIEDSPSEAYVLWLLAALIVVFTIKKHRPVKSRMDMPAAWIALVAAILLTVLFPNLPQSWPVWIGICSAIAWGAGAALAGKLSPAVFLFTVMVPSVDSLYTLLSFPLSRISTALTVAVLRLFGVTCSYDNAIIFIGEKQIAVTAACSGIELLAVLLLIGWVTAYFTHKRFLVRLAHYLTLLPIIIITNSLRLVILIALYLVIGDRAFDLTLHKLLGYGVVVASTLLLFSVGGLFSLTEKA